MSGFLKNISEMNAQLKNLSSGKKKEMFALASSIFLILMSYPFIRSPSEALFISHQGAKNSPIVWILSVVCLGISISIYNKLVTKISLKGIYISTCISFGLVILLTLSLISVFPTVSVYSLFIFKEVYVVLLLHLVYIFINTHIELSLAKTIFGPLGALGSLGGVLGGLLVTNISKKISPETIVIYGIVIFLASAFLLSIAVKFEKVSIEKSFKRSPLGSLSDVKKLVLAILFLVVLSQLAVNIVHFKFNFFVEENFQNKIDRTQYLASVFTWVNAWSFVIQILFVPFLVRNFSLKNIHFCIPLYYAICLLALGPFLGAMAMSALLIGSKALDYSLFATAKELLYFSLSAEQKYGAKYLVDMVGYRFAKGLISFVLIFVQSSATVNLLLIFTLVLWGTCVFALGRIQKFSVNRSLHEHKSTTE